MRSISRSANHSNGFTLVELIVVLVLVSALAIVAIPRFSVTDFDRQLHAERVLAGLRYAQQLAVTSGCEVSANINSATLALTYTGNPDGCNGGPVIDPVSGGSFVVTAPSGVSGDLTISFGITGQPTPITGGSVTIADRNITVAQGTGHVF